MLRDQIIITVRSLAKAGLVRIRMASSPLRMSPSFFLVGGMRCGTTSLFSNLVRHPNIKRPLSKEIRYFDFQIRKGERWYLAHFPLQSENKTTGEASPSYLFDPYAPARLYDFNSNARIIIMLRNPIDRAYSHYQHAVRYWGEKESFFRALQLEDERISAEQQAYRESPENIGRNRICFSYRTRGLYAEQVRNWLEVFDRSQIMIIKSEDYFSDPGQTIQNIQKFLQVDLWTPSSYLSRNVRSYEAIDDRSYSFLYDIYKKCQPELDDLAGKKFGWFDD